MPIRTHRGRAAVYRRFWAWPLRSPKHLVISLVGVTVLAFALVHVLPESRETPMPNNNPAFGGTTSNLPFTGAGAPLTTFVPAPPQESISQPPPPSAAPPEEAVAVARAWARAWTNHPEGTTQAQWLDGLRPHTTDEYLPVMASVDPANVPDQLTGEPGVVRSEAGLIEVRQPTNAGDVVITVIDSPKKWKVAKYTKVES